MDESNPISLWIRRVLIGLGLFVAGALLSFGYSYRPLHGSMTWKVGELERRIDERNLENMKLGDELARLRSQQATRVEPEALAQVEKELEKTKRALSQAEKDRSRTEGKIKEANASASRWRKRFEDLREQQSVAATAPAPPQASPAPSSASETFSHQPIVDERFDASSPDVFEPKTAPFPASPAPAERGMLPSDAMGSLTAP